MTKKDQQKYRDKLRFWRVTHPVETEKMLLGEYCKKFCRMNGSCMHRPTLFRRFGTDHFFISKNYYAGRWECVEWIKYV